MKSTPEQVSIKDRIAALLTESLALWPQEEPGTPLPGQPMVIRWSAIAEVSYLEGKRVDMDGEEVDDYFIISHEGASEHEIIGFGYKMMTWDQQ